MEDPAVIIDHIGRALALDERAVGRTVVVSAGPTREAVDPVRVLTNRSSGRMGFAIAAAAWRRGFDVHVIAGPVEIARPHDVAYTAVENAQEMAEAVGNALPNADALIMAAAIADFRPAMPAAQKIKKNATSTVSSIELEAAPDVLQTTRALRKPDAVVIGFALETEDLLQHAQGKLEQKGLDMIVANSATEPGAGFEGDTNRVFLIAPDREIVDLPMQSKDALAELIVDRLVEMMAKKQSARVSVSK
jgi:phosphopantothenoylcysteine decarboxylase/phosphopantothenate--cysteine ligase